MEPVTLEESRLAHEAGGWQAGKKRVAGRSVAWHSATPWIYSKYNGKLFKGLSPRNGTVSWTFHKDLLDGAGLLDGVKVETAKPRGGFAELPVINKSDWAEDSNGG